MLKRAGNKQSLLLLIKWMVVGAFLPAFLLCPYFNNPVLATEDWTKEREEIIQQSQQLQDEELKLITEMQELQIVAEALKIELKNLEREILAQTSLMGELNNEMADLGQELDLARAELAKVLTSFYYSGYYGYLEVIFAAENWGDLLVRLDSISRLVEHNHKHITAVNDLEMQLTNKKLELEQVISSMKEAYDMQKEREKMLTQAQLQKQQALSQAKGVSQELYQKLLDLERKWESVFPAIDTLLQSLPALPWFNVTPDKIQFNWLTGQTTIEVTEKTLNQHIRKIEAKYEPLRVSIEQNKLILSYVEDSLVELAGNLLLKEDKVEFIPSQLNIDGIPVQPEVLDLLTKEYNLYLNLNKLEQEGYNLTKIELQPGRLVFRVKIVIR
jgi:peptidoglycan hydrolase CwlO-like protein